ncbi:DASH family cryptochrome [Thalassotalea litorea]|uniref:Cryptochrome DASH n=1 Tax=Thalassotalea litorea TaxID=2020715 RepID=A0A5R9IBP0_9GAMM|nr:DASH family cryptochrome [Thalassotalea litorea]TLU61026.1 DASH family cryptochrome [Thalassotalea litorea]
MRKTLYCFTHDLRLADNQLLQDAVDQSHEIAFIYVVDPLWFKPTNYQQLPMGAIRWQFTCQALRDLEVQLQSYGHVLNVVLGSPVNALTSLLKYAGFDTLAMANPIGLFERHQRNTVLKAHSRVALLTDWSHTLYTPAQLRSAQALPDKQQGWKSFSYFRKKVEKAGVLPFVAQAFNVQSFNARPVKSVDIESVIADKQSLSLLTQTQRVSLCQRDAAHPQDPIPCQADIGQPDKIQPSDSQSSNSHPSERQLNNRQLNHSPYQYRGGETAGWQHMLDYFASGAASTYKNTRNALDGRFNSTGFSPYLGIGNISPRQIYYHLKQYEQDHGVNESTYWIYFELLWREYFQWLALMLEQRLFRFRGLARSAPLTSFFPERFAKWCQGNTPYVIVNACMQQLNSTGFMSNRGRQLVASCLVNELGIDWRYGAAYFQQQLIDYDVASNWGNWQYIAGVGVDPRGGRHFNLQKQTQMFDPDGVFIETWQGRGDGASLDSVDMVDWPIMPEGER